jgi:hypothetical protein
LDPGPLQYDSGALTTRLHVQWMDMRKYIRVEICGLMNRLVFLHQKAVTTHRMKDTSKRQHTC